MDIDFMVEMGTHSAAGIETISPTQMEINPMVDLVMYSFNNGIILS